MPLTMYSLSAALKAGLQNATCKMQMKQTVCIRTLHFEFHLAASQRRRLPLQRRHLISELANLDHLILGDVGEVLARVADRPEHLEVHDARRLTEPDVLLQR